MDKKQYDGYRQSVYSQGAAIVDKHDAYKNAGQLTAQALTYFIKELDDLMSSFRATSDANRKASATLRPDPGTIEASWLDPRFHDYYDFFTTISDGWKRDLASMTPDTVQPSAPAATPAAPPPESQGTGWTVAPAAPAPTASAPNVSVVTTIPGLPAPPPVLVDGGGGGGSAPPSWFPGTPAGPTVDSGAPEGSSNGLLWLGVGVAVLLLLGSRRG